MTMIEKVAEALFMEASKDRFGKWPTITEEARLLWRKSAKTAIEAMREPTDEMIEIGDNLTTLNGFNTSSKDVWEAMIDVALKED